MISAPIPQNETERLRALYSLELMDTAYEEDFDEIVQLASRICEVPISLITLLDYDRQWFKARIGLTSTETERSVSFCGHAILQDNFFEVEDAATDERFHDNPFVTDDPNIRYYGGVPLVTKSGYKIGTLCVIDTKPRHLDPEQAKTMQILAHQVIKLIELRVLNKKLDNANRLLNRSVAIMAHDIRNPLAAISMMFELKNEGILPDEDIKAMEQLVPGQVHATLTLLDNLLEWENLQLKGVPEADAIADVKTMCLQCFSLLELKAKEKGNKLICTAPENTMVECSKAALHFILRNLLTNACKFTAGGSITVSAHVHGPQVVITVSDTGIGMTEEQLAALKEKQYGQTGLGTKNEKGNGLGLILIQEYLDSINGHLEISSEKGKGSSFAVHLPLAINK